MQSSQIERYPMFLNIKRELASRSVNIHKKSYDIKKLIASYIFLFYISSTYAADIIYQNFENFTLGPIDGQGNWSSTYIEEYTGFADVVSSPTHTGTRSLHLSGFSANAQYKIIYPTPGNTKISYWYREQFGFGTNDTGNNRSSSMTMLFSDGYYIRIFNVNICHAGTGHRSLLLTADHIGNGDCLNGVGDMTEGNWYFIEVEFDFDIGMARARVDGETWGNQIFFPANYGTPGFYLEYIDFSSDWDIPPQFWYDDITINIRTFWLAQPLQNLDENLMKGIVPGHCLFGGYCARGTDIKAHNAIDYMVNAGEPVYAICDGIVKEVRAGPSYSVGERFTIIDHFNCGGYESLFAYYGHIDPDVEIAKYPGPGEPPPDACDTPDGKNYCITRDQQIGVVADWGNNSHLHFSINSQYVSQGWGYSDVTISTPSDCSLDSISTRRKALFKQGWLDPARVGLESGWKPFLLSGGSGKCIAPEQIYLPYPWGDSVPYEPWTDEPHEVSDVNQITLNNKNLGPGGYNYSSEVGIDTQGTVIISSDAYVALTAPVIQLNFGFKVEYGANLIIRTQSANSP